MRYPRAIWRPGPAEKAGYFWPLGYSAPKRGEVKHSAEGYWPGLDSVLFDLNRRSSWHFTIGYDRVEQHYDVDVNCWHGGDIGDDGGVRANIDTVGVEHLGRAGQPLTPYQVDETVRLSQWLVQTRGFTSAQRGSGPGWRLDEHNEVSDAYTSCPSGRIPWGLIVPRLNLPEEDDMAAIEIVWNADFGRLYVLGQGDPRWIADAKAAADLQKAYGPPTKALSWAALRALGA